MSLTRLFLALAVADAVAAKPALCLAASADLRFGTVALLLIDDYLWPLLRPCLLTRLPLALAVSHAIAAKPARRLAISAVSLFGIVVVSLY